MEEDHKTTTSPPSSSSSSSSNARWNPTKEQISMLEALYRQGLRTPTAEQIQQIAAKLRDFGTIEGKNVFYWFQNHKARQRQKQKQESMACLNRFFRKATAAAGPALPHLVPMPPHPSPSNVICSPYYYPQGSGIAYYSQVPVAGVPVPIRATADLQMYEKVKLQGYPPQQACRINIPEQMHTSAANCIETLQLFPLHPTGVLDERTGCCSERSPSEIGSEEEGGGECDDAQQGLSLL